MTRRRWVWAALAAALGVGGLVVWQLSRPTELGRVQAALDAADPGWRLADVHAARLADQPPPAENVVLTAAAARLLIPAELGTWKRDERLRPVKLGRVVRPWIDPAGVAAWRAAAEAVAVARRAADQPRGMSDAVVPADPFQYPWPTYALDGTRVADLLTADAVFAAAHGDPAGAVASVRALLSLARGLERDPFLARHLTALVVRVLAAEGLGRALAVAELPADGLAGLAGDLESAAAPARWATAVRDWRAVVDLELSAVARGEVDLVNSGVLSATGRLSPRLGRRLEYQFRAVGTDHAAALVHLTALLEIARRPSHEWGPAVAEVPMPIDDIRHRYARSVAEYARQQCASTVNLLAELRATAVAVECERFRLAQGRWPDALAELPPGDHTDPYTGRPLLLRRLADGLVVYSVGPNRRDDGGRPENRFTQSKADVGARLWDVAVRRQPVPPEDRP